ncbi:MAG: sigma-54-dependent Fis family transcriptional regulator, partial [Myxococcales bacterium]|nr:sigma-54-dependent Fis family transcriptional regulator [Myxococcales bacterium]
RDLKAEVDAGKFREDLYFRLNVIRVQLPALRDRREDVPYLVSHFLETFSKRFGRDMEGVDGAAMAKLQSYRWPGNVRELRNVVERLVLLAPEGRIHLEDLPPEIQFGGGGPAGGVRSGGFVLPEDGVNLEEVERSLIVQALQRTDNNQSASARLLGISRYALRYRMEKFGLK